jgi:hypothetical protein
MAENLETSECPVQWYSFSNRVPSRSLVLFKPPIVAFRILDLEFACFGCVVNGEATTAYH